MIYSAEAAWRVGLGRTTYAMLLSYQARERDFVLNRLRLGDQEQCHSSRAPQ